MTILLASAVLGACSKAPEQESAKAPVSFRAGISAVVTKAAATAPMGMSVKTDIMVFEKDADVASAAIVTDRPVTYTSDVSGNLTGDPLVLDTRGYDFYSVSKNTAEAPELTFASGKAPVVNAVDYLWAKTSKNIIVSDSRVTLTYVHSAVESLGEPWFDLRTLPLDRERLEGLFGSPLRKAE